jgi:hypothetical protein
VSADQRTPRRIAGALLLPVTVALGWMTLPLLPRVPEVCLTKRWFGRDCLTCGMTRAVGHFVRGDFSGAAELNGLVFPFFALIASLSAISLWRLCRKNGPGRSVTSAGGATPSRPTTP